MDQNEMMDVKLKVQLHISRDVFSPKDFGETFPGELLITFRLVSRVEDEQTGREKMMDTREQVTLEITTEESEHEVEVKWNEKDFGIPGAITVENGSGFHFFLKYMTTESFTDIGHICFPCNSWIYPQDKYNGYTRVFFANDTYLPKRTPSGLSKFRKEELEQLRGDQQNGNNEELQEWDRVYDYEVYNDIWHPDFPKSEDYPILGGSKHPYPRRGKTRRKEYEGYPGLESRVSFLEKAYIPRDERLIFDLDLSQPDEFDSFEDIMKLNKREFWYPTAAKLIDGLFWPEEMKRKTKPETNASIFSAVAVRPSHLGSSRIKEVVKRRMLAVLIKIREMIGRKMRQFGTVTFLWILRRVGIPSLELPTPKLIEVEKDAWQTDEEFAREMLAGVNPLVIRRLTKFPPVSQLDQNWLSTLLCHHHHTSKIRKEDIEPYLPKDLDVEEAMRKNRLFILDHHDSLMPYVGDINKLPDVKVYATRTILFLQDDSTLRPIAIELCLPGNDGDLDKCGAGVYTPPEPSDDEDHNIENEAEREKRLVAKWQWRLAKAYVAANDTGVHQLISHWLKTHAATEPFIIASNRQLSVLHPIYKLLSPHFRNTMNINSQARQVLINAGGIIDEAMFTGKYSMKISSDVYKNWNLMEQALPTDLIKREMAFENSGKLQLMIKDYPYAEDGLAIWYAIEKWVKDYVSIYYSDDNDVKEDTEIQGWWREIRDKGHGDLQDEEWWINMDSRLNLMKVCTIIIWIGSALHAAVNFGQYPYGGFIPNRPTLTRHFMPLPNTNEYEIFKKNPERFFVRNITNKFKALKVAFLLKILSTVPDDEVFLGEREGEWTSDGAAIQAFTHFKNSLKKVKVEIDRRNKDPTNKNRSGPIKLPYTLLTPSNKTGLNGTGIPNSISI